VPCKSDGRTESAYQKGRILRQCQEKNIHALPANLLGAILPKMTTHIGFTEFLKTSLVRVLCPVNISPAGERISDGRTAKQAVIVISHLIGAEL
jgi:hypothetical protein